MSINEVLAVIVTARVGEVVAPDAFLLGGRAAACQVDDEVDGTGVAPSGVTGTRPVLATQARRSVRRQPRRLPTTTYGSMNTPCRE